MLLMDIGNSRLKWRQDGLQKGRVQVESYQPEQIAEGLIEWFDHIAVDGLVVISSVASSEVNDRVRRYFTARGVETDFVEVGDSLAGVSNGYKQPAQLGVDRWVAMVSAYNKYQTAVCVIDAGTALTVDVVDGQGRHLGGLIMPGLHLMRQSLFTGTAGISEASDTRLLLANNTADAVNSGCHQMLVSVVERLIDRIESQYGVNLTAVVTGGDARLLIEQSDIDLLLEEWLIIDGLEQLFVKDN